MDGEVGSLSVAGSAPGGAGSSNSDHVGMDGGGVSVSLAGLAPGGADSLSSDGRVGASGCVGSTGSSGDPIPDLLSRPSYPHSGDRRRPREESLQEVVGRRPLPSPGVSSDACSRGVCEGGDACVRSCVFGSCSMLASELRSSVRPPTRPVRPGSRPVRGRGIRAGSRSKPAAPLGRAVLVVFSGPLDRPDGFAAELRQFGLEVVEYDKAGGGSSHDIRRDDVLASILRDVRQRRFCAVFLGVPCSTYSVARIRTDGIPDGGPPQVRDCFEPLGLSGLDPGWDREVRAANDVTSRAMEVASAATLVGASVVIENPVYRGLGSQWAAPGYEDHASLWDMPCVMRWRALARARSVDLAQCAFGGEFQKLTTLLYSPDLHGALASLEHAVCTHAGEFHSRVAHGVDDHQRFVTAEAAAYPARFNRALARAIALPSIPCCPASCCSAPSEEARAVVSSVSAAGQDPFLGPVGLRAGSAKPHAQAGEEGAARAQRATPSANPRRLEPERSSVLAAEGLPIGNVAPQTEWADPPAPLPGSLPGPFTTHQLIPQPMQDRLREFRIAVRACFEAARRGRWQWARDHRPKPLHASEEECLHRAGRGFVWLQSREDGLWRPLEPSSWPLAPPDSELEVSVIIEEALSMGFADMEIVSFMAHGYPGPEMSRETVLGPPHVGALKNAEVFLKCAAKDREKGWVRWGSSLPTVWPMRADPMNVVMRHGKGRMTIDKTMQLVEGLASYNHLIDLESQPEIEYVSVGQLARGAAILLTAGVSVKLWGFDLEAYFRKTGKQRSHWWMSGFVHADGFGFDPRIQFGQREAPVLCGRQSCFLVAAMRRELVRLEYEYPCRAESVLRWLAHRLSSRTEGEKGDLVSLFFLLMFVDDVGGASIDDPLYDRAGRPLYVWADGRRVHQTRANLYYHAAIGVVRSFGHSDAIDKRWLPCDLMVFLGLTIDLSTELVYLTDEKVDSYTELVVSTLSGGASVRADSSVFVALDSFNSLVHKLLHACTVVVLGRQHLFYCLRALHVRVGMRAGRMVPISESVRAELLWWETALERARSSGVPLASRSSFPDASDEGVIAPYSDASRELGSPESSGFGAWAIVGGVVVYVLGRWLPWELASLSINVLELAAMQFGTFTFVEYAAARGVCVSHCMEFTDNTAAEHSAERGRPHSERMAALVSARFHWLEERGVYSSVERVASVENDVADGLSRGGSKLRDALRIASATGLPLLELVVSPRVRSLEHLMFLS